MDGFDTPGKTKLIMATNGSDTLDPALLFPERLDRKIEIAPLGVDYTVPVAQKNYIIFLQRFSFDRGIANSSRMALRPARST